jgi:hypothetical protein
MSLMATRFNLDQAVKQSGSASSNTVALARFIKEERETGGAKHSGAEGRAVDDELLAHISPAHSENVNFFGTAVLAPQSSPPATVVRARC